MLLGQDGPLHQHTEALVECALNGELTHHFGFEKHCRWETVQDYYDNYFNDVG